MGRYHFECKPEECLLNNLVKKKEEFQHHSGRGQVCIELENNRNFIGLIDEDPTANHGSYYKRMYNKAISDKYGMCFCVDEKTNNRLIILKPKFEEWIINAAKHSRISMGDYDLSDDPNKLHREILFKINKLQMLIHQLIKVKNQAIMSIMKFVNS